jgi:hypothetical protein
MSTFWFNAANTATVFQTTLQSAVSNIPGIAFKKDKEMVFISRSGTRETIVCKKKKKK